ncbi:MAG: helix-turn-helix domain-containing protein [Nanoarchaeota archaeon]
MKEELISLGLTEREANAYIALYELKETTATQLSKITKEHRTNIYDSLNSLIKKGLISYCIKNNVKYFRSISPSKLLDYVKEKEDIAQDIIPVLEKKLNTKDEKPIVGVFEGKEGFKTILSKIINEGKTIYGIGASEEWEKQFPIHLKIYMKQRERKNIHARLLYLKNTKSIKHKLNEIRYLSSEYNQPSTIVIFSDYVAMLMWTTPLIGTLTKSKQLSDSFKKYFEELWKMSKK